MDTPMRKVHSSLPLQMALHFHLHLTPFILFSQLACFYIKYERLHSIYQVVLTALHLVSIMVELVRPYLGYYGNLAEKIPALTGFWIVTLILQIPITLFLCLNGDIIPLALERIMFTVHFSFLMAEVLIGGFVIRRLANVQMKLFKEKLDAEPDLRKK